MPETTLKHIGVAFVILVSCWCGTLAKAQHYTASVKHYGPENGLAHREVNAIFQDRQGFMWFGTRFGLNRFDGLRFTGFTREGHGLGFDDVQSVAEDADGYLWLMGPYGQSHITLFDPRTNRAVSFEEKFGKSRPASLFDVPQRLLGSPGGTIFFTDYQPAVLVSYHPSSGLRYASLPQFRKLAIFQATARNTVWGIADDRYLLELAPDGRILHRFDHPPESINVCFGQRHAGTEFFYFLSGPARRSHQRFYRVDESGHRREESLALLKSLNPYIFPVCYPFDRSGLRWDGMSLRDSTGGAVLTIAGQTAGEPVENRSFLRDRNGLFWLGTSFGVYQVKLAENHFGRLFYQAASKGESGDAIRGIAVLGDRVFANVEKSGLYASPRSGDGPRPEYTKGGEFAAANALIPDGQGKLYAGIGELLVHYDPATGTRTTAALPTGLSIWALHAFGPGQWLVGSRRGLFSYGAAKRQLRPFAQYNQFTELAQAHVLHIGPDRQGNHWICANTGLYTVHPEKGVTARYWSGGKKRFYLPAESYHHFYQDTRGIYWLATANAGLIRWDRRLHHHRQFRRSEGLSNNNIYAVYPDAHGYLWMSSDYGLMHFNPARFTTRAYFVEDGITHNEFNRIAHCQDQHGRMYFGGLNGITAFDPADFRAGKPGAGLPLRITGFRQYNPATDKVVDQTSQVTATRTITLPPDDRSSVLDFALLNYANAEKNVYAYRFSDLDPEWTYQPEPSLRLSNLPYGAHQLLIRAQAGDGQWSANTLSLNLVVVRPFYLRAWFLLALVLAAGAGLWAWVRWRVWHHKADQRRLETQIRQATARMAADKDLIERQAHALLRLHEARSHFFANISHEFRTPLTVILGMAAQLRDDLPAGQRQPPGKVAGLIERNGNNLLRLINQILDLSKLESGGMHLHPVRADLARFIRYTGESFHSMARARDIEMHYLLAEETLEADFDPDRLGDILSNLLGNALKFTPGGGHIYYQLRLREGWQPLGPQGYHEELVPAGQLDGPWIQLGVSDTGPGIPPASLPDIFARFYQADNQPVSPVGGTGIGLSLVRELVLLMRGGLAVRSRPAQGAEFVVSLPLTRNAPPAAERRPAPEPTGPERPESPEPAVAGGDRPVLLLVEDNPDVAVYTQACLGTDYQVVRAENGQAGFALALDHGPDVILSDVMMPLMDGFALCEKLKNDPRTSHIPVILLTARAAAGDRITGLRRGADAYLTKPFQREELLIVLDNLVRSRHLLQIHYGRLALGSAPDNPVAAGPEAPEDQFVLQLRRVVEAQLGNADLSADGICQLMGMSRTTLHKKMTALTGLSISRYLRALRLRKAQELLADSSLNVAEVAYAVGFEDPKYFSRVFSEAFGVSPGHFRDST